MLTLLAADIVRVYLRIFLSVFFSPTPSLKSLFTRDKQRRNWKENNDGYSPRRQRSSQINQIIMRLPANKSEVARTSMSFFFSPPCQVQQQDKQLYGRQSPTIICSKSAFARISVFFRSCPRWHRWPLASFSGCPGVARRRWTSERRPTCPPVSDEVEQLARVTSATRVEVSASRICHVQRVDLRQMMK